MTSPVDISPVHLKIVQGILRENLPPGVAVWVFGSRANWTTKDSSDLDLALEGDSAIDHGIMVALETAFEESNLPYTVDVVDLNHVADSFRSIVENQKIRIASGQDKSGGNEWRKVSLDDCTVLNSDTFSQRDNWNFINYLDTGGITNNYISEVQRLIIGKDKIPSRARRKIQSGDIVYSTVRPNQRHFGLVKELPKNFLVSTGFVTIRGKNELALTQFLYWFLIQDHIIEYLQTIAEQNTSAYPSIRPSDIGSLDLYLPPLEEQRRITHMLNTLDDKINLNRRMNHTLEEMARTLFKSWFVDFDPVRAKMEGRWRPDESLPGLPAHLYDLFPSELVDSELGDIPKGWEVKPLDEIADYRNGLALQNFRPKKNESKLPVVKIAQLRRGHADGKEWAKEDITSECKIDNGDVIFSWSGSLMVKVWCGGRAALNQHLFKVTSTIYPKWFYLYWLSWCLPEFQSIAASKATTMGHIKRHHLQDVGCTVPNLNLLNQIDYIFSNLLSQQISYELQGHTLVNLRNVLLPKLISGEIRTSHLSSGVA